MGRRLIYFAITGLICISVFYFMFNKELEGYHFISNLREGKEHTFKILAESTSTYKFECVSSFLQIKYSVYDVQSEELITFGTFGQECEAYYPFMIMELKEGHRYKIKIAINDEIPLGFISIKKFN